MKNRSEHVRILLLVLLLLGGCARTVMIQQHGDAELSCDELAQELDRIMAEISGRLLPTDPAGPADTADVTDIFLLQPARYRQLDRSAQLEVNALVERYNYLVGIGRDKDCECTRQRMPEFE